MLDLPMLRLPARVGLLIFVSACLQVASFPFAGPLPYWRSSSAWFALVPFLVALVATRRDGMLLTIGQAVKAGYLCGIFFYLGNCYWIYQTMYLYGGLPKVVALVILMLFSLYLGLYHALFAWILIVVRRSALGLVGALALGPFAWVTVELARARVTGFPWDLLGYSQIDNRWIMLAAPVAGVMGVSFVLMAVNAVIAFGLLARKMRTRVLLTASGCGVVLLVMLAGSRTGASKYAGEASAVLLQENLSVGAAARERQPASLNEELSTFSRLSLAGVGAGRKAAIVIWPEAPSHLFANDTYFRSALEDLARHADAAVIAGSIGIDQNLSTARGYSAFDSAAVFDRSGTYLGRYDKIHLVPWGEYVPYKQFFAFAQKLTEGVGDMDPGTARSIFRTDGHAYGIFICYESIFGDEVRQFVRNGAEVLVNISDDGWYGDTGAPWQHLNMARMRAVENHRWLLRDTNTGETTVIDPDGRYTPNERHVRTAYVLPYGFTSGTTFYTRHGDWFAWLAGAVTVLAFGYGLVRTEPAAMH